VATSATHPQHIPESRPDYGDSNRNVPMDDHHRNQNGAKFNYPT
jgi:hypothetical protein